MTTAALHALSNERAGSGGAAARRAVIRWGWRLFRREWRQQLLILALITVAVGATIVGSTVAIDTPPPADAGFGTAHYAVLFGSDNSQTATDIARLSHAGRIEVIENETEQIPGSIASYQLRSESPHGPYIAPMLSLVAGRFPAAAGEVAVTRGVGLAFDLHVGSMWRVGGVERRVVGIVENPQSLLDEFALVVPGQVTAPSSVVVLANSLGGSAKSLGGEAQVETPASVAHSNPLNPETISLAALVFGMLLIMLVSAGGFTVLAQRRLRSIGMLEAMGATDRHVRLVVRANATVVGLAGALLGFVLGLVVWLSYRPSLEQDAHHTIGTFAFSWAVVAAAMVLSVAAAFFAASRPARAVSRVSVIEALSGRPAPPAEVRRSALPGVILLVLSFLVLGYAGGTNGGSGNGGMPELALGIILLIPGLILLAPLVLSFAARLSRHAPISARLALRDLARYRARSGSALGAISVAVLASVIVMLAAAARYGNVLDYAGPNLSPNELLLEPAFPPAGSAVYKVTPSGKTIRVKVRTETKTLPELDAAASAIARGLGAKLLALKTPNAHINGSEGGRQWTGNLYVATPRLLRTFGISTSEVNPAADIVTSRPGLSGVAGLRLSYGSTGNKGGVPPGPSRCDAAGDCLASPVIQEMGALPSGTSAPNTLITEHAMREFHISSATTDWLVQGTQTFTASEVQSAEFAAAKSQLSVESKNDEPSSLAVITWALLFGVAIALGVLAMSVGLVRSETASDLRTLEATGASGRTRRMLTAVTAGALGFLGALLGTVGGYVGMLGWLRSNSLNGGISALGNVPVGDLLLLLLAMPGFAALMGWLLAGRPQSDIAHRPIE